MQLYGTLLDRGGTSTELQEKATKSIRQKVVAKKPLRNTFWDDLFSSGSGKFIESLSLIHCVMMGFSMCLPIAIIFLSTYGMKTSLSNNLQYVMCVYIPLSTGSVRLVLY